MTKARTARTQRRIDLAPQGLSYTRFSTEMQGSIPEQDSINDEISQEHGVEIVARFSDAGVSRSVTDRPGLVQAFAYLEDNPQVGFIVVNELERLTAGVYQRAEVVRLCKRLRISIITEENGVIDPFDEEKMHVADQRAVAGAGEVLKIRRRTRRNLRQKVIAGTVAMRPAYGTRMKPLVGPDGQELPSGARLVDVRGKRITSGVLEKHPEEYPWLLKIFEWAGEGKSSDQIARDLTDAGVPTKSGRAQWRGNTINGILDNPLYKGQMVWGHQETLRDADGHKYLEVRPEDDPGRIVKVSPLGALVDPALWDAIHAIREVRVTTRRMKRRKYDSQVFDDFVFCGRCGHRMYGRNDAPKTRKVAWRYFCYSMRPGYEPSDGFDSTCTTAHSMSMKQIFTALASFAASSAEFRVKVTTAATADVDPAKQRVKLAAQIKEHKANYDRAVDLAVKGLISVEKLTAQQAATDAEVARLEEQVTALAHVQAPLAFRANLSSQLAELLPLLQDETLPVAVRVQALHRMGLRRIYLDKPGVLLDLLG